MGETGKSRRAERSAPGPGFASDVSPSMRSTLDADLLRHARSLVSLDLGVRTCRHKDRSVSQEARRNGSDDLYNDQRRHKSLLQCKHASPNEQIQTRSQVFEAETQSYRDTPVRLVFFVHHFRTRSSIRQEPYAERSGFWSVQQLSPDVTTGLKVGSPQIMLYLNRGLTGMACRRLHFAATSPQAAARPSSASSITAGSDGIAPSWCGCWRLLKVNEGAHDALKSIREYSHELDVYI